MKLITLLVVFGATFISVSSAYRILGVFPRVTRSHFIVFESLMRTLAKRGHQVDVVSHYPQKSPIKNYNDIISLQGLMGNNTDNHSVKDASKLSSEFVHRVGHIYGNRMCDYMGHEKFQKLIKYPPKDPSYDLVITQVFLK